MRKDIKDLWVAALRSGNYEQGQGALVSNGETGTTFCCLGVLCEVAVAEGVVVERSTIDNYGRTLVYYNGYPCMLPESVQRWAGLNSDNGEFFGGPYEYASLIRLNDDDQLNFNEIAGAIERYYELL